MPISEKTRNDILQAQANLAEAYNALQAVLDGKTSISETSRRLGIGTSSQSTLEAAFRPYIKARLTTIKDLGRCLKDLRSPANRLMLLIFDQKDMDRNGSVTLLPGYDEAVLWNLVDRNLSPRRAEILKTCVGYGLDACPTIEQAADMLRCTAQNVMSARDAALRTLRGPEIIRKLYPGMSVKESNAFEAARKARVQANVARSLENPEPPKDPRNDPFSIYGCGLSGRTMNAMARAGHERLEDIAKLSLLDLLRVRNLGQKSVRELYNVILASLGVDRSDWLE